MYKLQFLYVYTYELRHKALFTINLDKALNNHNVLRINCYFARVYYTHITRFHIFETLPTDADEKKKIKRKYFYKNTVNI